MRDIQVGKIFSRHSLVGEEVTSTPLLERLIGGSAEIIGEPILSSLQMTKGGNNITLLLETAAGRYVAKHYPLSPGESRDRYAAEAGALRYMNDAGINCVPTLIGSNDEMQLVVMDGSATPNDQSPAGRDIADAIRFVHLLRDAANRQKSSSLPLAAEACISPNDLAEQIRSRRQKLDTVTGNNQALSDYLQNAFDPAFAKQCDASYNALAIAGISADAPLPVQMRTLSPSDFGFHNSVRRIDGSLVFIDFEYFGWDDPVRLVSDFILHPGHQLIDDHKRYFVDAGTAIFAHQDPAFQARLRALFPLIGMRWCMILLNEFLPEKMARRRAAGKNGNFKDTLNRQLGKSRQLLVTLNNRRKQIIS